MKIYENYNLNERYSKFIDSLEYDERIEYTQFKILENQKDIERNELDILEYEADILQMKTDLFKHSLGLIKNVKRESLEGIIELFEDNIARSNTIINMSKEIIDSCESNIRFYKYEEKINNNNQEINREGLENLLTEIFKK